MDMSKYLDLFLAETREHLSVIEEELARLERSPDDAATIYELFRHAHSIKGMAASMGYRAVAELAHAVEDLLEEVKEKSIPFTPAIRTAASRGFDRLGRMIDRIAANEEPGGEPEPLIEALRGLIDRRGAEAAPSPPSSPHADEGPAPGPAPGGEDPAGERPISGAEIPGGSLLVEVAFRRDAVMPAARAAVALRRLRERGHVRRFSPALGELERGHFGGTLRAILEATEPPGTIQEDLSRLVDVESVRLEPIDPESVLSIDLSAGAPTAGTTLPSPPRPEGAEGRSASPPAARLSPTLRVPARSLDRFLDTVGELIVQRARLERLLAGRTDREIDLSLARLARLVDRLSADVMTLRMLPFETVAHRFVRSVRELADEQGKSVTLLILGREVLLDRSMLDELVDPINHILRNAVDHGIEDREERARAEKPETGTITISLTRAGDSVTISIEDDGRGMDPPSIRSAAVERGFITRESSESMSDADALMLTTIPGFSTAGRITSVSGRGVGMDVVRTRVESLGGHLALRSTPCAGSVVEMRLPLTIVVVPAFIVEAANRRWAVPVASVERTIEVDPSSLTEGDGFVWAPMGEEWVLLRGLAAALSLENGGGGALTRRCHALVAAASDPRTAIVVDRILGRRDIVVKPLGPPLEELRSFSGAAVLEDGRIALILDLLNLSRAS